MSIAKRERLGLSRVYFALAGASFTAPSSGTLSISSVTPDPTDPIWQNFVEVDTETGIQTQIEYQGETVSKKLYVLDNGRAVIGPNKRHVAGSVKRIVVNGQDVGPLATQLIYHSDTLTSSSTQFNEEEGAYQVEGLLKQQGYDSQGNWLVINRWVILFIPEKPDMGPNLVKPIFHGIVVPSVHNTGSLPEA